MEYTEGSVLGAQYDYPDDAKISKNLDKKQPLVIRQIICRYGRGCTHLNDPVHKERFWHPPIPIINEEQKRTHYICNECGYATPTLQDLQLHLLRKTAWSNTSLIGCRISCLNECKEWHEGYVTQYHRSGKHFVEFRLIGEKRWMNMKKVAFYIVERPHVQNSGSGEFKENDLGPENDGLAPVEDNWVYSEDVSLDYAFAQSVLFKVYGSLVQETGHKTRGHTCLTEDDRDSMRQLKGSLLYGELLPRGANKAFGPKRLSAQDASVLFDLGMGTGKIAIQAFLQFRNLKYVYGVELSTGRYNIAVESALRMIDLLGQDTFKVQLMTGRYIVITEILDNDQQQGRVLHMECGDMFDVQNISIADVVMLETDIPTQLQPSLCQLLSDMHEGSRTLTYLDLRRIWTYGALPFRQMENNKQLSDRFPTSWSVQRGHHFYLWTKVNNDGSDSRFEKDLVPGIESMSPSFYGRSIGAGNNLNLSNSSESVNKDGDESPSKSANNGGGNDTVRTRGCFPASIRSLMGLSSRNNKSSKSRRRNPSDVDIDKVIPLNSDGSRVAHPAATILPAISSIKNMPSFNGSAEENYSYMTSGRANHLTANNIESKDKINLPHANIGQSSFENSSVTAVKHRSLLPRTVKISGKNPDGHPGMTVVEFHHPHNDYSKQNAPKVFSLPLDCEGKPNSVKENNDLKSEKYGNNQSKNNGLMNSRCTISGDGNVINNAPIYNEQQQCSSDITRSNYTPSLDNVRYSSSISRSNQSTYTNEANITPPINSSSSNQFKHSTAYREALDYEQRDLCSLNRMTTANNDDRNRDGACIIS